MKQISDQMNEFVEKGYLYFQNRNRCFVSFVGEWNAKMWFYDQVNKKVQQAEFSNTGASLTFSIKMGVQSCTCIWMRIDKIII